ncbi:hypothetical protein TOPH_05274 [Tolypocladium ophioglossoides CBS 100239]|uniref:Uncharacterized protein n=1 Tax=Tolypocladium ophioglossoides (strain CBS 100239) TaxID=1163406 RepID=A0A0L0N7Q3_TOLOC|nr:hypothetical protein TOPH_05274 [Tolypocladium ophioglossoides CBS 100239]
MVGLSCSRGLLQATKYYYTPTKYEESRRRQWIRDCLIQQLSTYYHAYEGLNLVPELWRLIVDELQQCYSVANARSLWAPSRILCSSITTAESIWCGFVEFEGIVYVSSLSNAYSEQAPRLISLHIDYPSEYLLVVENHLGITKLLLASSRESLAVDNTPGLWWRTIRFGSGELTIDVESDGIKLRRLTSGQQGSTAWDIPEPSQVRFHSFINDSHRPVPARMASFKCNNPATNGYSLLWASGLVLFHAHTAGEDMSFYQSAPYACWLYMPTDHDEIIIEVWQRKAWATRDRAVATNKGRIFVGGAYLKQRSLQPFVLVERLSRETSRIFFEDSTDSIGTLAFASDAPRAENLTFIYPQPSRNRVYVTTEDFFFSSHRLEGLAEIIPLIIKDRAGVSGMLLLFSDGHRESVGQVRLDSLDPSVAVGDAHSWFLAFGRMDGKYPYVTALGTTRSEVERDSDLVLQLFHDGTLEWIWSHRQCLVIYEGQKSLETV